MTSNLLSTNYIKEIIKNIPSHHLKTNTNQPMSKQTSGLDHEFKKQNELS